MRTFGVQEDRRRPRERREDLRSRVAKYKRKAVFAPTNLLTMIHDENPKRAAA